MLAVEVGRYLDSLFLGVYNESTIDGTIYIGQLPPDPDEVIMVKPSGGQRTGANLSTDMPTIQIIVRGTRATPVPAETLALQIYNAMIAIRNQEIIPGATWVHGCQGMQSGPTHIGVDKNGRHEYSLNFELTTNDSGRLL
jgi:hypothetical protein